MSANDLNRCEFIGRLGADPDNKFTPSGAQVVNMRLACNWRSGEKEGTEWVSVVAFGKLAEICATYLRKGSQVYIAGRLTTRKWQDRSGADRYTTEIVANDMQMLDRRQDTEPTGPARPARPMASGGTKPSAGAPAEPFDDPIPF